MTAVTSHNNRATPEPVFSAGPSLLPHHTVIWQLQEKVFSVGSLPRLYHKEQWDKPVRDRLEMAELEESEIGVKLPPACEDVSPGTSTVGRCYPAVQ
jgi:hypothetical protein